MLRDTLAQKWEQIQGSLFPWLTEEIGEINEKQQQLISILELLRVEKYVLSSNALTGRKEEERTPIARAFVAKAVTLNIIPFHLYMLHQIHQFLSQWL